MGRRRFEEDLKDWNWRDLGLHSFLGKLKKEIEGRFMVQAPRKIPHPVIGSMLKSFGPMGKLGTALKIIGSIVTIGALAFLARGSKKSSRKTKSLMNKKSSRKMQTRR